MSTISKRPTPIVDGQLYGLGGTFPLKGQVTWVPKGLTGYGMLNCYLLTEPGGAMIIDTSAGSFEQEVLAQLAEVIDDDTTLSILLTRIVEFDSMGNAAAMLQRYPVDRILSHFLADEYVYYSERQDPERLTERGAFWPHDPSLERLELRPGQTWPVLGGGEREVEIVRTPLRLLNTYWIYDAATKALMTSDAFGTAQLPDADADRIVTEDTDTTTVDDVEAHLLAKYEWIPNANTDPIRAELEQIFETHEVEYICPNYGRVIKGRSLVERHLAMMLEVLQRVPAAKSA